MKILMLFSFFVMIFPSFAENKNQVFLACFYYDPKEGPSEKYHFGHTVLWAKNNAEDYIAMEGNHADGFFMPERIYEELNSGSRITLKKEWDTLKTICTRQINKEQPGMKLLAIRGVVEGKHTPHYIPIIIDSQNFDGKIKKLIIFGDSLLDAGYSKTKESNEIKHPSWHGRHSNGRVAPDYLEQMGYAAQNYASSTITALRHPITPSSSEAKTSIIENKTSLPDKPVVLAEEIDRFLKNIPKQHIQNPNDALFVIWSGMDDYVYVKNHGIVSSPLFQIPQTNKDQTLYAQKVVHEIIEQIKKLYHHGARHFLILPMPLHLALGNKIEGNRENTKENLEQMLAFVLMEHNKELAIQIDSLRKELKQITITEFDVAKTYRKFYTGTHPHDESISYDYGFHDNKKIPAITLSRANRKGLHYKPDNHMFWDGVQLSSLGHCWLAYFMHETLVAQKMASNSLSLESYRQSYCE